jgi:hypothetical protein
VEEAIHFGRAIEDPNNEYHEGPTRGLSGMRRLRQAERIPLATNTVVVNFEQFAANILGPAVDVILLDTTFWGGIRACVKAAGVCGTFQLGIAVHSSGELGIHLATMPHLGAEVPNLALAGKRGGGPGRNRTGIQGFAVLCITTLPPDRRRNSATKLQRPASLRLRRSSSRPVRVYPDGARSVFRKCPMP